MTAQELLETMRRSGAALAVVGDRLRIEAPPGVVTPELRQELVSHKSELISELSASRHWPAESLDAERRFGGPYARLFPFLGQRVDSVEGPGILEQVFADRVAIALVSTPSTLTFLLPSEVWPAGRSRSCAMTPLGGN
ncbi:MAG: hypothetical protein AAF481_07825 [Acidobacteriota bacterium]